MMPKEYINVDLSVIYNGDLPELIEAKEEPSDDEKEKIIAISTIKKEPNVNQGPNIQSNCQGSGQSSEEGF